MKRIDKEILRLAIPNIVSNVSIPLLSSVDTILMGNLSVRHLAAVGAGSMIFNMIYWNFGFLRMGTTGLCAQAYGKNDTSDIASILLRSTLLALVIAVLLLGLCLPILSQSIHFFNISEDTVSLVTDYFLVRIWAAPATLLLYVLFGWLFGMQNAIIPLIVTILINTVNIVASYWAVEYLGLETRGVAIGTVIAQYVGVVTLCIIIAVKYKHVLRGMTLSSLTHVASFLAFFKVNLDLFIRTVCLTFVFSFFYSQSFKLGVLVIGVNVILQQFVNWMSYGIDGFAYATESLVGKYKGASDTSNLESSISRSIVWGAATAILYSLGYLIFGENLMQIFSSDEEALQLAYRLKYFVWIFPLVSFWSYIWDGIFVGLVASRSMRNTMALSLGIFLAAFYCLPKSDIGEHIWIALMVFVISRGVSQFLLYRKNGLDLK